MKIVVNHVSRVVETLPLGTQLAHTVVTEEMNNQLYEIATVAVSRLPEKLRASLDILAIGYIGNSVDCKVEVIISFDFGQFGLVSVIGRCPLSPDEVEDPVSRFQVILCAIRDSIRDALARQADLAQVTMRFYADLRASTTQA